MSKTKQEKKISVIVPVFNVENYLDKCMNSIVRQTYHNLEIILINDGSSDSSGEKCDIWKDKDTRIRVIHKENGGLSDARNAGLETATGAYIGFVDSDDFIEPDFFGILVRNLNEYQADISCCRFARVWEDGKREPVGENHQVAVFAGTEGLREYLYAKVMDPFVCNKLYRRETIGKSRFIKGIIGEDNPFNYEVFLKAEKIVLAGESGYNYLQARSGAITSGTVTQKKIDSVYRWEEIRRKCLEDCPELEPYALRRAVLFYVGLYNNIRKQKTFSEEQKKICAYLKEHFNEVQQNEIFERTVKISVWLLVKMPRCYQIVMRLYKKIVGRAKL